MEGKMDDQYFDRLKLVKLLELPIKNLLRAADAMLENTFPFTPLPRPREFIFFQVTNKLRVAWPCLHKPQGRYRLLYSYRNFEYFSVTLPYHRAWGAHPESIARAIVFANGSQPKDVFRALRIIQVAIAWCKARKAGRERHAQEILRQQAFALETINLELAMVALSK